MPSGFTSKASAALVAAAVALVTVDAHADEPPFSATAAKTSDTTLVVVITTPVALQIAGGVNDATGGDLLLYGESLTASGLFNLFIKWVVRRPRPYTTSTNPRIRAYADGQDSDARLSFY